MKKTLVFLLGLTSFLACCKKGDKRQYSYWYVNSDSFSTNDVVVDKGKARTDMKTNSTNEGFGLTFYLNYLPMNGNFQITNSLAQGQYYIGIGIWHKGQLYNVLNDLQDEVVASTVNGKAQYKINNVWFKNYFNSNDTVLINGTFNEP